MKKLKNNIKITDLTSDHLKTYFCCLEDWSSELQDAGNHKEAWYLKMKDQGLRVKVAIENDKVCGMIQYLPIELSHLEGKDLYFITCIWVHGYNKGIGNFQKRGIGTALLQAAEEDIKALQAKGCVAWGLSLPFWMKAAWFKKKGYRRVDKDGMAELVWKPFTEDAVPPCWIKLKQKPEKVTGKVTVASFMNGWCPAMNLAYERAKMVSAEFGDKVAFQEISTFDKAVCQHWGLSDALFIDGKQINIGPPPSAAKLRKLIARRIKGLK